MTRLYIGWPMATVAVAALFFLAPIPAEGQAPVGAAQTYSPPRTPDGRPELSGIWQVMIHYEITLQDPKAYTRPWKMAWPIIREKTPGFQLLEEACWEGERDLPKFLEFGLRYYFGETWRSR